MNQQFVALWTFKHTVNYLCIIFSPVMCNEIQSQDCFRRGSFVDFYLCAFHVKLSQYKIKTCHDNYLSVKGSAVSFQLDPWTSLLPLPHPGLTSVYFEI